MLMNPRKPPTPIIAHQADGEMMMETPCKQVLSRSVDRVLIRAEFMVL